MEIKYDKEADAVYIEFGKGEFAKNQKLNDFTILDLDKKGNIIGIEILDAKKRISARSLTSIKNSIALTN